MIKVNYWSLIANLVLLASALIVPQMLLLSTVNWDLYIKCLALIPSLLFTLFAVRKYFNLVHEYSITAEYELLINLASMHSQEFADWFEDHTKRCRNHPDYVKEILDNEVVRRAKITYKETIDSTKPSQAPGLNN